MATAADIEGEPLVVVVHRRVKPGQERSFEAAMGESSVISFAIDNKAFLARGKLSMPVLAIGGEK